MSAGYGSPPQGQTSKRLLLILIPIIIVAVVLIVVVTKTAGNTKGETASSATSESEGVNKSGGPNSGTEIVTIGDAEYVKKNNVKTYLFMGIDNQEMHTEEYNRGGFADMLRLLVVDRTDGIYTQLPINRNTMMNVGNYSANGEYLGDSYLQVAYAHMGGDGGGSLSCENTVNAVSDFLGGQKIDGYIALKMDAIPMLNNLVGGVTVTIEDDFSQSDPSLVMGETVKLTDDQAWHYVHDRMNVGDGTNECRMRRQDTYIAGLKEILYERAKEDENFALDVYHTLMNSDYLSTNMTDKEFGRIVNSLLEYESAGQVEIQGTLDSDKNDYVTFTADEQSVEDAITTLFYRKEE